MKQTAEAPQIIGLPSAQSRKPNAPGNLQPCYQRHAGRGVGCKLTELYTNVQDLPQLSPQVLITTLIHLILHRLSTHSLQMAPALLQAATLALRAAASVCPVSPTCPQDNQCSMTTNGVSLQVSCATDYYGGDLQLAQVSDLFNSSHHVLTIADVHTGWLHERLCYHHRMCCCKLRRGQLLHEERSECRL